MSDMKLGSNIGEVDGLATGKNVAFDYLRSFGVLLVLLHHTILAYVTFGFLNPTDPMATFMTTMVISSYCTTSSLYWYTWR